MRAFCLSIALVLMVSLGLVSCDKDNPVDPSVNNLPDNMMTAMVNGKSWTSTETSMEFLDNASEIIGVKKINAITGDGIAVGLINITTTGTYTIGTISGNSLAIGLYLYTDGMETSEYGGNSDNLAQGTLTITEFSSTRIQGTFSYTADRSKGSAGPASVSITNGAFNIRLD